MSEKTDTLEAAWPLATSGTATLPMKPRLGDLNGKRVGFVWDYVFRGDEMFPMIAAELERLYPGVEIAPYELFGNIHGKDGNGVLAKLPERLREEGIDAAVIGVGNCGSCTPAVMRGVMLAEQEGIPSVGLVSSGFEAQAKAVARALGIEGAPLAVYPGVIPFDSRQELETKIAETVLPAVLDGFAKPLSEVAGGGVDADPASLAFTGTYDEIQEHFHANSWTDGLPITPPTSRRVDEFLSLVDRDPDEVIGILQPEFRNATVRSVAVNGVMAGCKPEYMPILVAAVEAIADPEFNLQHAGATPGWEPMVVVSGPITEELGFYSGTGALRVGTRANTSIGRFMRLCFRNLAGWIPGQTDKGTIGSGFNVALSENDEATAAIGWPTSRVDRGFAADDNIVTVQSVLATSIPVYSGGTNAEDLIGPIRHHVETTIGPWAYTGLWYGHSHILIVMSPAVAGEFARHGWSKDDIRRHIFTETKIKAGWVERYPIHAAGGEMTLERLVSDGVIDASYIESDDPEREIPLLIKEQWTDIVLAGDPGRNQSRIYFNNHEQGPPTSKRIELSDAWRRHLGANPADA